LAELEYYEKRGKDWRWMLMSKTVEVKEGSKYSGPGFIVEKIVATKATSKMD